MIRHLIYAVAAGVLLCGFGCSGGKEPEEVKSARNLAVRILDSRASDFRFELIKADCDSFCVVARDGKVKVCGSTVNAMAYGLNRYLNECCLTTVSWYADDKVSLPELLPETVIPLSGRALCPERFFLNYCTFGYSMPWWGWKEWERVIDWMALHGINLPLAITGQESVWYRVWRKLGLTDPEIRNYFTGPAHLPWHRMSNLDYWQGPLPKSWLDGQEKLQKKIVARERELGMKPVLPAFSGHVPAELTKVFPDAKITPTSQWGDFDDEYRSHFLDPMDSLFAKIQKLFLEEQTALYGTDHIYGLDAFNEVMPPDWNPEFLASCSRNIYSSLSAVDPDAVWLQMTWMFYMDRELWTNDRIRAYLTAVPAEHQLLLDYYCENTEIWRITNEFFGTPFIWCYLGNFGGNTMLAGNFAETASRIDGAFAEGGKGFKGLGSTLEGFDVNPFMYEYVFSRAWSGALDKDAFIKNLADRMVAAEDSVARQAWHLLADSVYIAPAQLGQGILINARPSLTGHGNWTTVPDYCYSDSILYDVWSKFYTAGGEWTPLRNFELVNIGRQVLGNLFGVLRDDFTEAYSRRDVAAMKKTGSEMLELIADLDSLLATRNEFLLGKWLGDARAMSSDPAEQDYYELNARTLITLWGGPDRSLNDYANRSLAGITATYYAPRWELFIHEVIESAEMGKTFDADAFHKRVTDLEAEWVTRRDTFTAVAQQSPRYVVGRIINKYNPSNYK